MRSYKAARRAATKAPVEFDFTYQVDVETRDEEGNLLEVKVEDRTVHFTCNGEVSTLLLSELAYNSDLDLADPEAVKLIRALFSQAFGVRSRLEEDGEGNLTEQVVLDDAYRQYQKFFRLQTTYGDDDLLMSIMGGLVEDFMGRPTVQPSASPGEESKDGQTLKVVSLSRGTVREEPLVVPGEVVEKEKEKTKGSPVASSG